MADIIRQTRDAYNKIAHHFSGTRHDLWPELKQFEPLIKDGQNILDWGCGNGRLILLLKGKKVKYFGADQSEELIKIAKKKYAAEIKAGWVKFFCTGDTRHGNSPMAHSSCLSLGDIPKGEKEGDTDFFDLVFMIASFHHLPDEVSRLKILKKVYQEMKPGAKLIMTNWNLGSDWAKEKISKKGWKKISVNDFIVPWKNPKGEVEAERYYHCFSEDELRGLLARVGFEIDKMGYDYTDKSRYTDDKGGRNLVTMAVKNF